MRHTEGACTVSVKHTLPCGHIVDAECSQNTSLLVCKEICTKILVCSHTCTMLCGHDEGCVQMCEVPVKKTLPLCDEMPRHWSLVACHIDVSTTSCRMPCREPLSCGHECLGTCSSCASKGAGEPRVHEACKEPCQKELQCNHVCVGDHYCGDFSSCPACIESCPVRCSHRACDLPCGAPCKPCESKCDYACPHMLCIALCCQPHECYRIGGAEGSALETRANLDAICAERCTKRLGCGHPCMGFCGEACPESCAVCRPNVFHEGAIMLALECGHSFEDNSLYQRISSDFNRCYSAADMSRNNQLGRMPFCPHSGCQRTVNGPHRYSSLMRQYLQRLEPFQKVKRNELLCRQFAIDEDLGSEKVNKLLEMLSESGTGQFYADLKSVIHLLLGKSYLVSGNLSEAETNLKIALSGERDNTWLHIEGLTCLGYLQLCGGRGEEIALQSIESASARSLELSMRYLQKASSSSLHDIQKAEELFGRKTGSTLR